MNPYRLFKNQTQNKPFPFLMAGIGIVSLFVLAIPSMFFIFGNNKSNCKDQTFDSEYFYEVDCDTNQKLSFHKGFVSCLCK